MLYMVIEKFKNNSATEVYRRAHKHGRMLPEGLRYIDSWVDNGFQRCFQLMETDDENLFNEWTKNWKDLVEFEIIPVISSQEAANRFSQDKP